MSLSVVQKAIMTGHNAAVYALEQGIDAEYILSGSADNMVAMWSLKDFVPQNFSVQLEATIYSICFIPDKSILLVGQTNGGIHVIDLNATKEIRHLALHTGAIFSIKYTPKTNQFYVGSADGSVSIWDLEQCSLITHNQISSKKIRSIYIDEQLDDYLIVDGDGQITVFDLANNKSLKSFIGHDLSANCLARNPITNELLTGGRDAHLKVWNTNYELIKAIPAHNFAIYDIAFHPTGKYLATASRDKTIKIWDANTYEVLVRLDRINYNGHTNSVNKLYWSTYNNYLLSTGDDRSIIVWEVLEN